MCILLFPALLLFIFSIAYAQDKPPSGSPERGYQAYMKYQCYTCHGTVGQGGGAAGPRLAPNPMQLKAFISQVRMPRRDMPAYRAPFVSDQELTDMHAYLLTIKPPQAAKEIPLLDF